MNFLVLHCIRSCGAYLWNTFTHGLNQQSQPYEAVLALMKLKWDTSMQCIVVVVGI